MLTVTFGGDFTRYPLMRYDYVFCDESYAYPECPPEAIRLRTGITGDEIEKRRTRIAMMMMNIIDYLLPQEQDILFLDTDVWIPEACIQKFHLPTNYVIMAQWKPSTDIKPFTRSTNIYIPYQWLTFARQILQEYLDGYYLYEYVDINLSIRIGAVPFVCYGTKHKNWVLTPEEWEKFIREYGY